MSDQASYASSAPARPAGAGFAIAALVLGILAVLSCWTVFGGIILGLAAIVLGIMGWRRARSGAGGGAMAITGVVLGTIGLLLSVVLIAVGVSLLNNSEVKSLRQCLSDAGSNQQKMEKCQQEFKHKVQN